MNEMLQSLNDPASRHAMLIHWPIVLAFLGLIACLLLALWRGRVRSMTVLCVAIFAVSSGTAWMAAQSGESAEERVEGAVALSSAEEAAIERHEELGELGWLWLLIPAVLAGVCLVPRKPVQMGAATLSAVAAGGVCIWVALTAHAGGELVYRYGLGVPVRGAVTIPAASESDAPLSTRPADRSQEHEDDED